MEGIYAAAAVGAVLRIVEDDGYVKLPQYVDGRLDLGIAGKLIAGIVGAFLAVQTGLITTFIPGAVTPLSAFAVGFAVPFTIERFFTKLPTDSAASEEGVA